MFLYSAKSFMAAFFMLVALVLISSASCPIDAKPTAQQLVLSEYDLVTAEEKASIDQASWFIGDLIVGSRRENEGAYGGVINITNLHNNVHTIHYCFAISKGTVHYVSILNKPGSYTAICELPSTLGLSARTCVSVRTPPESTSKLSIFIAAH